jgi:hypothetical protein
MKNKYLINTLKGLAMILMTASLVNCSKSSSGGSNSSTTTGYKCYNSSGTQVDNSQCTSNPYTSYYYCRDNNGNTIANTSCYSTSTTTTSSAYTLQNGQCYYNNGSYLQPVAYSLCLNSGTSGYTRQSCATGTYYYQGMMIQCGVTHYCPTNLILQTTSGATIQCL